MTSLIVGHFVIPPCVITPVILKAVKTTRLPVILSGAYAQSKNLNEQCANPNGTPRHARGDTVTQRDSSLSFGMTKKSSSRRQVSTLLGQRNSFPYRVYNLFHYSRTDKHSDNDSDYNHNDKCNQKPIACVASSANVAL